VIGFDSHRLVELCYRFVVSTGLGKRLRVTCDIADIVREKLIGLARKLQLFLRRTRALRKGKVVLRRALSQSQRLALERRPVEQSLRPFQRRTLQKPDFSQKSSDRVAAIQQPNVADLEVVAIEFDMPRVAEIGGVVKDVRRRDETLARKSALYLKIQPARVGVPAVLERRNTRIDRILWRERDRRACAGEPAETDRGVSAHA
jgi:hypothetical protein